MDEILKQMRALIDTAKAENRDLTAEEIEKYDALNRQYESAKEMEKRNAALEAAEAEAKKTEEQKRNEEINRDVRNAPSGSQRKSAPESASSPRIEMPRVGRVRNFTAVDGALAPAERAYRFGRFCLAAAGNQNSARWCADHGIELRGHTESVNTAGGFLVPEEFDMDLIDLREQYGVFRRNARIVPMSGDTKNRRRRTGGLTAYFAGEGEAGTASTKSWDMVQLVTKKLMTLSTYTNELNEDAAMSIGDDLISEIAYTFAKKEDECGFIGDGTSTYGGILGAKVLLNDVGTAGVKSATSGSHTNWAAITLRDMEQAVGVLPEYAETNNVKWFCSKAFFANVMSALAYAAGGNTTENIGNGVRKTFLGYPVEITQTLPRASGTAEIVALFGDLRLAADFGDRRQNSIAFSEDATVDGVSVFETDEIAIRGTTRFDINVHDVGSSTEAGPIVAIKTAA